MKKKLLILGSAGMAGHMVHKYLSALNIYDIYTSCFRTKLESTSFVLDVHDKKALETYLAELKPDFVVNCIGVLIKGSKISPENCIYINAYYPHFLSSLIHKINPDSRLIHISTDCVFSGKKGNYTDTDEKDALDVYGMTKNLGEVINEKDLTIRTSIIGPEIKPNGEGLFHWLFSQKKEKEVYGYTKSIWGGVTTLELAKAVESFLDNNVSGLFQLSNGNKITKFELLELISNQFKLSCEVKKIEGKSVDKSLLPSKRSGFNHFVPEYKIMISELFDFMKKNNVLYAQYLG